MLEIRDLEAGYGGVTVLRGAALRVRAGEIHCLLGRNGAGKTTLLKAVMGHVRRRGSIRHVGSELTRLPPHEIPKRGIGYVPQGRRLFADLTVAENLTIGLMARRRGTATRARLLALFPRLGERLRQRAGTLSGGEQQMLAMARALALEPTLLLLDEPTEGLQPSMIAAIRDTVAALRTEGVAILLVEQRVEAALALADRVTFMENGRTEGTLAAAEARARPDLVARHVGVAGGRTRA